eukprot:scaffold279836_cov31-Tisochrysis_lutea.AAC.3
MHSAFNLVGPERKGDECLRVPAHSPVLGASIDFVSHELANALQNGGLYKGDTPPWPAGEHDGLTTVDDNLHLAVRAVGELRAWRQQPQGLLDLANPSAPRGQQQAERLRAEAPRANGGKRRAKLRITLSIRARTSGHGVGVQIEHAQGARVALSRGELRPRAQVSLECGERALCDVVGAAGVDVLHPRHDQLVVVVKVCRLVLGEQRQLGGVGSGPRGKVADKGTGGVWLVGEAGGCKELGADLEWLAIGW